MKFICGLIIFFVLQLPFLNFGQSLSVFVKDNDKLPLIGATVQLTYNSDSIVLFRITNNRGLALFENVADGLYHLRLSYVGFETIEKNLRIKEGSRSMDFRMTESTIGLDAVTITATRPLIRQEGDKMIIDPEPLANSSTNTLEILESTPGLFVDQDGGIFLTSATPAVVYINGREQKMSSQDINTILTSLPPGSVQHIEIMRTPSSKYDAASSGGIINIVLKKGVKIGRFGSVNAGMNQGIYGNRFAGLSFNNSGDKSTSYINLNYSYNDRLEELSSTRFLNADTAIFQTADIRGIRNQAYIGYGLNYDINENLIFNYDGRFNASFRNNLNNSVNYIEAFEEVRLSESSNRINNDVVFLSLQQDFGLRYKLDTLGSEWDTKLSFNYNSNNSSQDYSYHYINPLDMLISGEGNNTQQRNFIQFQTDLNYYLPHNFIFETGFKSTYQHYYSDAAYYKHQNGSLINDAQRTNAFNYQERINAAYTQASRGFGKGFMLKAGVRIEHTYMNGNQTIPVDTNFIVSRADWFPYVYLSRSLFEIGGVDIKGYAIYRKTINRPAYDNLNPYVRYIDQFLYETGNPSLKPQFTENIELNVSYDDTPLFAIGQNFTNDIFSSVMYSDEVDESIAIRTYDNLGKNKETYFRLILGIPPGKRYFFAVGSQYNLNEYNGFYENQALIYTRGSWRLFTFHSLRLFKETRLTMSGFLMTNGQYNFFELDNFGMLNFGINQNLMNKKLSISLSARDVLRTMVTEFELNQGSMRTYGSRYTDNRRIVLNIRYNFGIKDKKEKRQDFEFNMETP